jgi:phosphopantetheinyl transferase
MEIPSELLQVLQKTLGEPTLQIAIESAWGANHEGFHEKIKSMLATQNFTDSSISHTQDLGGFACIKTDGKAIGFDIELIARVSDEVAKRVCTDPTELSAAPSPAHLWVAKEAAFKALKGKSQPLVLSQIVLTNWRKQDSQIETYHLLKPTSSASIGVTFQRFPFIFSLFLFLP